MSGAPFTPFLELDHIGVRLAGRTLLDNVSLALEPCESVALVGPNGSGKSTLLRAILGLVPFTGSVRVDGRCARRDPIGARSRIAWVPQRPAFGDATAREWLSFVARVRRVERSRIGAVLDRTGLAAHAREKARLFSGGMQQRLAIASALLDEAPLLLLDEPTASLDREGRSDFVALVLSLREEGRTLLFASHRQEEVKQLADRTVHLENGRVIEMRGKAGQQGGVVVPLFRQGEER